MRSPLAIWNRPLLSDMTTSNTLNSNREVSFTPWIGPRYTDEALGGTRLLVLSESHYGEEVGRLIGGHPSPDAS
jgi:hypothetical protein